MEVLKFGGTSVGTPEGMRNIAEIISTDSPKIVVLSALSGDTNTLDSICKALYAKDNEEANSLIDGLEKKHATFIEQLIESPTDREEALESVRAHLNGIRAYTKKLINLFMERSILAQGEIISTHIFYRFIKSQSKKPVLLSALDFMRIDNSGEPDAKYIAENLEFELSKYPERKLFITQGYICRNAFGEIDNLKRGGSDYSASLIGAAIDAENIQIWTDIDGMHNNDPRVVPNTQPIKDLSFKEAAELAYFGAKILHPASIRPAEEKAIPVWLKNTMKPESYGTLISDISDSHGFKAVAAKDGITAIKIRSGRMLMAYGFLRSVFEVFERFKTPIDMITTSEVAVSVTIDDTTQLSGIMAELESYGQVLVDEDLSIICVVGDFLQDGHGYAAVIFDALKDIPIRMISYGGSNNNISLLVRSSDKKAALLALNKGVFKL